MELNLAQNAAPLIIGATGMDALLQNIRVIVTTLAYSVPLDRTFAGQGSFIDAPTPLMVARRIAELTEIIEAKEPRVRVTSITFASRPEERVNENMQGRVYPRITFELRPGVTL